MADEDALLEANENFDRVLARIRTIDDIRLHPDADRLNIATIGGWEAVVPRKDAYAKGARGVFIEIDSVLPEAEWVSKNGLAEIKWVKTKKIRGVLSQGIFLILSDLPPLPDTLQDGEDVTSLLGIEKHVVRSGGSRRSNRDSTYTPRNQAAPQHPFSKAIPEGPPKTDEPRVQNSLDMVRALGGLPWVATLKIDGQSATFGAVDGELVVCSRNLRSFDPGSTWWRAAVLYGLEEKLVGHPDLVLQGEVYGPDIQCNRLNKKSLDLAIFNVWRRSTKSYVDYEEMLEICKTLGVPTAPMIMEGNCFFENTTIKELLEGARGMYVGTRNPREGLVFRPKRETRHNGGRLSFKCVNNDYLEKFSGGNV